MLQHTPQRGPRSVNLLISPALLNQNKRLHYMPCPSPASTPPFPSLLCLAQLFPTLLSLLLYLLLSLLLSRLLALLLALLLARVLCLLRCLLRAMLLCVWPGSLLCLSSFLIVVYRVDCLVRSMLGYAQFRSS